MVIKIGMEKCTIFEKGKIYACTIKGKNGEEESYKIYGGEFDLSCKKEEFCRCFRLKSIL